jgi:hypothetical protein
MLLKVDHRTTGLLRSRQSDPYRLAAAQRLESSIVRNGPVTSLHLHGDRAYHALDERPFWARRDARRAGGARTNSFAQWIMKCLLLGIKWQVTNTSDVALAALASGHSTVMGVYLG